MSVSSQGSYTRKTSISPTSPTYKGNTASTSNEAGITRNNLKVSFKDRIKNLQKDSAKEEKASSGDSTDSKQHLLPSTSTAKPKKQSTTQQLRDKFKSFSQIPKDELTPWSKLKLATVVSLGGSYSSLNNSLTGDSPKLSKTTTKSSMPVDLNAVNELNGSLSTFQNEFLNCKTTQKTSVSDSELKSGSGGGVKTAKFKRKPKPFKLTSEPKSYRSVDDLSPEYSGLPFVKKLKILNERQKLAELESVIQTRSFSLDYTESNNPNDMVEVLTRSQSEASCMVARPKSNTLNSPVVPVAPLNFNTQVPIKSPLSPESNETLERKQLKSILKRLSEDRLAQNVNVVKGDRPDMKRLMRAQTMEGYVARRTKFTKSVTFNNTLSSPPNEAPLTEEPEDSAKLSPPVPFNPSLTPLRQPPPQALYPISNAQDTSTNLDKSQNLLSNRIMKPSDADPSTNRFNFPDDLAVSSENVVKSAPLRPKPTIDDPSRSLSFVSDDFGQRKIVKGIQLLFPLLVGLLAVSTPVSLYREKRHSSVAVFLITLDTLINLIFISYLV